MTNQEKIDILNSIEVVEDSFGSHEVFYIRVANDVKTRILLKKIGLSEEDIEREGLPHNGTIDILEIAYNWANASWSYSKEMFVERQNKNVVV